MAELRYSIGSLEVAQGALAGTSLPVPTVYATGRVSGSIASMGSGKKSSSVDSFAYFLTESSASGQRKAIPSSSSDVTISLSCAGDRNSKSTANSSVGTALLVNAVRNSSNDGATRIAFPLFSTCAKSGGGSGNSNISLAPYGGGGKGISLDSILAMMVSQETSVVPSISGSSTISFALPNYGTGSPQDIGASRMPVAVEAVAEGSPTKTASSSLLFGLSALSTCSRSVGAESSTDIAIEADCGATKSNAGEGQVECSVETTSFVSRNLIAQSIVDFAFQCESSQVTVVEIHYGSGSSSLAFGFEATISSVSRSGVAGNAVVSGATTAQCNRTADDVTAKTSAVLEVSVDCKKAIPSSGDTSISVLADVASEKQIEAVGESSVSIALPVASTKDTDSESSASLSIATAVEALRDAEPTTKLPLLISTRAQSGPASTRQVISLRTFSLAYPNKVVSESPVGVAVHGEGHAVGERIVGSFLSVGVRGYVGATKSVPQESSVETSVRVGALSLKDVPQESSQAVGVAGTSVCVRATTDASGQCPASSSSNTFALRRQYVTAEVEVSVAGGGVPLKGAVPTGILAEAILPVALSSKSLLASSSVPYTITFIPLSVADHSGSGESSLGATISVSAVKESIENSLLEVSSIVGGDVGFRNSFPDSIILSMFAGTSLAEVGDAGILAGPTIYKFGERVVVFEAAAESNGQDRMSVDSSGARITITEEGVSSDDEVKVSTRASRVSVTQTGGNRPTSRITRPTN